jgi:hypothetical protein
MASPKKKGMRLRRFTFILFLEQLKRDFSFDNKPVLTLKKFIQTDIDKLWLTLKQPNEQRPIILIRKTLIN